MRKITHAGLSACVTGAYLVRLDRDTSCSAHCKCRFIYVTRIKQASHFAWQVQHWVNDESRDAKQCVFQSKMLVVRSKSNLGCETGCGVTVSF